MNLNDSQTVTGSHCVGAGRGEVLGVLAEPQLQPLWDPHPHFGAHAFVARREGTPRESVSS